MICAWLVLFTNHAIAQEVRASSDSAKPYQIEACATRATIRGTQNLTCSDNLKTSKQFRLEVNWKLQNGVPAYAGFSLVATQVGTCHENDELRFTFTDQTNLSLRSWSGMDCEGKVSFDYPQNQLPEMARAKLLSLQLLNGMSSDQCSCTLSSSDQDFFIRALQALEKKRVVTVPCN